MSGSSGLGANHVPLEILSGLFQHKFSTLMRLLNLFKARPSTMSALTLGIILLVIFPFGAAASLLKFDFIANAFVNTPACHYLESILHLNGDKCATSADMIFMLKDHRWWEVIAFFWVLGFTALFLWFELPKQYEALNKAGAMTWAFRLSLVVTGVMVCSYFVYIHGIWIFQAGYRSALTAKVILAVTFVTINFLIIDRATKLGLETSTNHPKKRELKAIANDFKIYNSYIDMPTLFALSILLFWDQWFAATETGNLPEFISGASSVILVTTGFLFGVSVLRDAPEETTSVALVVKPPSPDNSATPQPREGPLEPPPPPRQRRSPRPGRTRQDRTNEIK
jgi:hypothetical protein